jgi:hypothetical protein
VGVVSHSNAAGDVAIGLDIDGDFVPFVTLSAGKIAQLRERHQTLVDRADAGDELAIDALGTAHKRKSSGGGSLADLSRAELVSIAEQKGIEGVNSKTTKAELIDAIEEHESQGNGG